jgi:hypothetical protein
VKRRAEQQGSYEREEGKAAQREQKTGKPGWPAEDRLEAESTQGVPSAELRETTNGDGVSGRKPGRTLLEQVLERENMFTAQERVVSKRGSAGIDGMSSRFRGIKGLGNCSRTSSGTIGNSARAYGADGTSPRR